MGSPDIPTKVDPIGYLLEEQGAVQLPPFGAEDYFRLLEGMVQKAQPHFRDLFYRSFKEEVENLVWRVGSSTWSTPPGEIPELPPHLTKSTKCLSIITPLFPSCEMRFVVITRNGRMFLLHVELKEGKPPLYHIKPLSKEVFLQEWEGEYSQTVHFVNSGLYERFHYTRKGLEDRAQAYGDNEAWLSRINRQLPQQ